MTHLAMAFTIAHPGVTSALLGARTMDHLDGLLAGRTSPSPTTSSTGSTRSSRPAPTSAPSTRPTNPRPWRTRACAAAPRPHAPRPD